MLRLPQFQQTTLPIKKKLKPNFRFSVLFYNIVKKTQEFSPEATSKGLGFKFFMLYLNK